MLSGESDGSGVRKLQLVASDVVLIFPVCDIKVIVDAL